MLYLHFKHDEIPKSNTQPVKNVSDDGGARRKCGCGKYNSQPSTKAGLVLQVAESPEREKNE
jgi:hypothetical protein